MPNNFLYASKAAILRHGISCSYISVVAGAYNVETGATVNTETTYTVISYKRHVKTNQYNYPNLIGKNVGIFYIANDALAFVPKVQDKIVYNGATYTVESLEEGTAHQQIVLYKLVGVLA